LLFSVTVHMDFVKTPANGLQLTLLS